MTQPCRFSVRCNPSGGWEVCFEVVDGVTGAVVASDLRRPHAATEARRRARGVGGEPAGLVGLLAAIDAFLADAGHYSLSMVARAAQALDELREELARTDRVIVEQQTRLGPLYMLFPDLDTNP